MHIIRDPSVLPLVTSPDIRQLIAERIEALAADGEYSLQELAFFIVVEPGDTLVALDACVGFPVLGHRYSGLRFGDPGYTPGFEILEEHPSCYEMVFILSDDGFGVQVFVPKVPGVDADLLAFCAAFAARYALPAPESP